MGFSLFITRQILYQLGGEIVCKSELGVGSEFSFVVSLNPKQIQTETNNLRCLNPFKREYKPFKISVRDILQDYEA